MKRYRISKFYIGVTIVEWLFALASVWLAYISVKFWLDEGFRLTYLVFTLISLLLIVSLLYICLTDFELGCFTVNETGITLYIGFKKHYHRWEEFNDCDVVGVSVDSVGGKNVANAYWVYFATRPLTQKEKIDFLRKTRRDLDRIAFFQYNRESLNAVMPYIKEEFRARLNEKEAQIQKQMNFSERIYHR